MLAARKVLDGRKRKEKMTPCHCVLGHQETRTVGGSQYDGPKLLMHSDHLYLDSFV